MRVKYIGLKPSKTDNVAGSGIVWSGQGDVQEVPDEAAQKLLRHPEVWCLDEPADKPAGEPESDPAGKPAGDADEPAGEQSDQAGLERATFKLQAEDGSVIDLATMDDKALKAFVTEHGLSVDLRKRGDALRGSIMAAIDAAAKEDKES